MRPAIRQRLRLSAGTELSFITAGKESKPAVLLLHGFPGSAGYFREVVPELSQAAYVIAPDLPGFGASGVLPSRSTAPQRTAGARQARAQGARENRPTGVHT
jgi:pimeloyl-ACP methyl ester carboxylesterase